MTAYDAMERNVKAVAALMKKRKGKPFPDMIRMVPDAPPDVAERSKRARLSVIGRRAEAAEVDGDER